MVFERFTWPAQRVIETAHEIARAQRSQVIETHHLLIALAHTIGTDSSRALEYLGIAEADLRLRAAGGKGTWLPSPGHIPFAARTKEALWAAVGEADRRGDRDVRSGDVLLMLVGNERDPASRVLVDLGVDREAARAAVKRASSPPPALSAADLAGAGPSVYRDHELTVPEAPAASRQPAKTGQEVMIRVECAEDIDAPASDRIWAMLSSPGAWSLWHDNRFTFDGPGAERLRLTLGSDPQRGGATVTVVHDEIPGRRIILEEHSRVRPVYCLSLAPDPRSQAVARIAVTLAAPRDKQAAFERTIRQQTGNWLRSVRDLLEGRAPAPGDVIPPEVHARCMAPRRMELHHSVSASVVINAGPDVVWDAVSAPATALMVSPDDLVRGDRVPGTPTGQVGEMRYFIGRNGDDLYGSVVVVADKPDERAAVTRLVGPPYDETSYRVTNLGGQSRLDILYRRPFRRREEEIERRELAGFAQSVVNGYKAFLENVG